MKTVLLALLALLTVPALSAATLPEFTGTWVNGAPLTREGLKGKAAVLYFYEEGCPTCRNRWPGLLELRQKFADEPVAFIAVNSGNAKAAVLQYLTSVKADWPGYVDLDRSFEKKFGFEISLSNIYQTVLVDGSGNFTGGGFSEDSIRKVAATAKWKVPPAEIPDSLKKTWRALEFGQMSIAAPQIKQALGASDARVKEAAKKLEAVVVEDIKARLEKARADNDGGQKWEAYKGYAFVAENYKDFAEAKPAAGEIGKLRSDKVVARELQAKVMFDKCVEWNNSPKNNERTQAQAGFQSLAAQFADTEAGAAAKGMVK